LGFSKFTDFCHGLLEPVPSPGDLRSLGGVAIFTVISTYGVVQLIHEINVRRTGRHGPVDKMRGYHRNEHASKLIF
jgi:hypothetical protein